MIEEEPEGRKRGNFDKFVWSYSKHLSRRFSYHNEGTHSGKRKHSHKRRKSEPNIEKEHLELETITTIGKNVFKNTVNNNHIFSCLDSRYGILN